MAEKAPSSPIESAGASRDRDTSLDSGLLSSSSCRSTSQPQAPTPATKAVICRGWLSWRYRVKLPGEHRIGMRRCATHVSRGAAPARRDESTASIET